MTREPKAAQAQKLLFKPDRPRDIDQYIDYFGGAADAPGGEMADACGEAWLERPA